MIADAEEGSGVIVGGMILGTELVVRRGGGERVSPAQTPHGRFDQAGPTERSLGRAGPRAASGQINES
jgi:hypothetical protein